MSRRAASRAPERLIRDEADLAAHLDALVAAQPAFEAIREAAGEIPFRWLEGGFPGLVWVVTGQQISVAAGRAIYNRCEAALGRIAPETILAAGESTLKAAGYSRPKIRTLHAIAEASASGALDLDGLETLGAEEAVVHLTAVKGVGPWTAEVYLIFAHGHPDILPAKDVALQEAARLAFAMPERPGDKALAQMAEDWRPHRSAAARLLWAYYRAAKNGAAGAPLRQE